MFANNRIASFDTRIHKSCLNCRERILSSSNVVIAATNLNNWVVHQLTNNGAK